MEFTGIDQGLASKEKQTINATAELKPADCSPTCRRCLTRDKPMHYLSLVKPQMIQQVLLHRALSEEGKAGRSTKSRGDWKVSGEGELMELFPLHPSFDTTKPLDTGNRLILPSHHHLTGKSAQQAKGLCLLNPFGVGGAPPAASRRPVSPATTPRKQSSAQLTIFYGGTVNVYDLPAERAQAIMNILGGNRNAYPWNSDEDISCRTTPGSSNRAPIWKATPTGAAEEAPTALPTPKRTDTALKIKKVENLHRGELPLVRRQSLHRFIEKRQIRLNSVNPYTNSATLVNKVLDGTATKFSAAELSGVFVSGRQLPLA